MKNDKNEDEFGLDPKYMDANEAGFRLLSTTVKRKACTHLMNTMNLALSRPAKPTNHNKDSEDNKDSDYSDSYLKLTSEERQQHQLKCLKTLVYMAWQALLQNNEAAADRILQKMSNMKCYRISNVAEHLDKINNLHESYKSTVEGQCLKFEQSMLSEYLIKSLPDSYHLTIKQSFRGKTHKDKKWINVMVVA